MGSNPIPTTSEDHATFLWTTSSWYDCIPRVSDQFTTAWFVLVTLWNLILPVHLDPPNTSQKCFKYQNYGIFKKQLHYMDTNGGSIGRCFLLLGFFVVWICIKSSEPEIEATSPWHKHVSRGPRSVWFFGIPTWLDFHHGDFAGSDIWKFLGQPVSLWFRFSSMHVNICKLSNKDSL